MTGMFVSYKPHPMWLEHSKSYGPGEDFEVIGCVPTISFMFTIDEVRSLPPAVDWPSSETNNVDKLFEAGVDERVILSEIIKSRLAPELFGCCVERAGNDEGITLFLQQLDKYRLEFKDSTWIDQYIAAGRQAYNRLAAHQLLKDFE